MDSSGGTRKRKIGDVHKERAKEDEEEKIEEFFALIRSTREMREQMRRNSDESKGKEEKKVEQKVATAWNPSFQPEDFGEDTKDSHHHQASSSRREELEQGKKEEDGGGGGSGSDKGLDLKLSL
ncbi:hypothetical protein Tsubulata_007833 [Turnera subulata]|uniref:Uncharacterized protein n=1 Tax=Turnera subulata TaxID=218843 RepID=A0A9Q0FDD5_9ROSI|nr:hypothetical protein Tsubulata_007833 [Turnera subulata]